MKASPLILAWLISVGSAQAFPGSAQAIPGSAQAFHGSAQAYPGGPGPHSGVGRIVHVLGHYGGARLFLDTPEPEEPPRPAAIEKPYVEAPAYAPTYPQPYYIPMARPRRSGPRIIYIGRQPRGEGPRIIYGVD